MASKSFEAKKNQKEYWGSKLNQRLSFLTEKGFEPGKIAKDTTVRKFRAKMRETGSRLKTIASKAKKVEEMARIKAEKAAAPKEEKGKSCLAPPTLLDRPFLSSVFSTFNRAPNYNTVQPHSSAMNGAKSITYGMRVIRVQRGHYVLYLDHFV